MLLIYCRTAAMGAEYDMINEMGIAHNGAKISKIPRLCKCRQAMGSPPATMLLDALPAVPPLPLASLGIAGGTAGYSKVTLRVRHLLYIDTGFCR